MTNAEKYLKDEIDISQLARELTEETYALEGCNLEDIIVDFFNDEVEQGSPILTEDERAILRNIDKEYRYIHRGATGETHLYVSDKKWDNGNFDYRAGNLIDFCEFDHLFQFIKERRRIRNS